MMNLRSKSTKNGKLCVVSKIRKKRSTITAVQRKKIKDMVACEKKRLAPLKPEREDAENEIEDTDSDQPKYTCSEGEGQMMLDALNGFLIFISKKGTIKFVSQTVTDHIGLQQENLIGKNVAEILHPNDQHEVMKQFTGDECSNTKAITDGSDAPSYEDHQQRVFYVRMKYNQQSQGKVKGSGYILVQWSGKLKSHVSSKTGQVVVDGFVSICRPMRTTSVVEIRMDGNMFMSRHDLGMTFTFCDTRIITLIGYEPDELIGKTAYHFHNPLDAPKVSDCHQNLIVKGTSVSKYYRFLGKNDNWVWLQTRATIIYNTNNKPQYIVCMNYVISEEEGERYLMLEEHKHANNSHDNTCLTLPDNHITVSGIPVCAQSRPRIIELTDQTSSTEALKSTVEPCIEELNEENLEKTACFNGELDHQPATSLSLASSVQNGYQCSGRGQYHTVVNGYQQTGLLPQYQQAGSQQYQQTGSQQYQKSGTPQYQRTGTQQFQQQARDPKAALSAGDPLARVSSEGSPESTSSSLSPCSQQDQYSFSAAEQGFDCGNGYMARDACHSNQSYSEDGGYESATSPYSSSYLSPQILSPGSLSADSRADCGYSDSALRTELPQCQSSVFGGGYNGTAACGSGVLLQGGNSNMLNGNDTAELCETDNILEALLEGFSGQTESSQLDMTIAAICSTMDNLASQNSPSVTTHVKSPGVEKHKHRSMAGLSKGIKPKDKSLLRSILTMPEDDIPKHSITFLNKAKSQNAALGSDLSRQCSEARQMKCSSARKVLPNSPAPNSKKASASNSGGSSDVPLCSDKNGSNGWVDYQEMPSDITDFALQYLDTLTDAQTEAVIADLNSETLMDTNESDFKKELFSTITCQLPDNNFHSSCDIATSQAPFSQSYMSPVGSQGSPAYSQTVSSNVQCTSNLSTNFRPNASSSHDHVYHQSNKYGGNGIRQINGSQTAEGCNCSPQQSRFSQTRNCNTQMSDSRISELEKHLRDTTDVYQANVQYRAVDEVGTASRPFLRQLLTGELTKDRYIQMERERCGYSKGIRPQ